MVRAAVRTPVPPSAKRTRAETPSSCQGSSPAAWAETSTGSPGQNQRSRSTMWMAFSKVARYSLPRRFFCATQNAAAGVPELLAGGDVGRREAAVEADHQDALVLVGEVGEPLRVAGRGREGLLAEDIHVRLQRAAHAGDMLRPRGQHEQGVQVTFQGLLYGPDRGGKPHRRTSSEGSSRRDTSTSSSMSSRATRVGSCAMCAMFPAAGHADTQRGRAHRDTSAGVRPAAWSRRARSARADRAKPSSGAGRSCGCHRYSYSRLRTSS